MPDGDGGWLWDIILLEQLKHLHRLVHARELFLHGQIDVAHDTFDASFLFLPQVQWTPIEDPDFGVSSSWDSVNTTLLV